MKAMILAAGLGTRLRPLTDHRPKALVEVQGQTLLQIALRRLASFGIREVIVNVHHFPDMVVEYLKKSDSFGMRIEISREDALLDTGGGLKKAAWFFLENSTAEEEPFLLHNVDVISTIDFHEMLRFHREKDALATLAVQERNSSRYLLFNERNELCGRWTTAEPRPEMVQPPAGTTALAFCGIHVISNRFLRMMTEDGAFSIIASYLRLAEQGENIVAFRAEKSYWRDLGRPENVRQAELDAEQGMVHF
jgi:NDP-sugar pyrophosphorylase family protein